MKIINKYKKKGVLLILVFLCSLSLSLTTRASITVTPNTRISLLTCGAGYEIYSMYGHTAIRIKDSSIGYDYVVNYGIFSMGIDNFAWLYLKGETDYEVAASTFEDFMAEYRDDNREVYENEIQIPDSGKRILLDYLAWNLEPENKVYRYKFFSDNCATRIRDLLERSMKISWNTNPHNRIESPANAQFTNVIKDYWQKNTNYTFRDIILIYQDKIPWVNAGIQIPIAAPADTHLTYRAAMFLPDFLMDAALNASTVSNGKLIPLVKPTIQLLRADPRYIPVKLSWFLRPQAIITAFFLLIVLLTIYGLYKKRLYRFIDVFLLLITGLIGILLVFMSFISVHECMRPNYNLWWAFPFNFFVVFIALFSKRLMLKYYFLLMVLYGLFFISLPFIPQTIAFIQCVFPLLIIIRYSAYFYLQKTLNNK